jgi:hypothetical protein
VFAAIEGEVEIVDRIHLVLFLDLISQKSLHSASIISTLREEFCFRTLCAMSV